MAELIRSQPSDRLALNLGLVVDALDGQKDFAHRSSCDDVILEFGDEALAFFDKFLLDAVRHGEGRKEKQVTQAIVQITQRVGKRRISTIAQSAHAH